MSDGGDMREFFRGGHARGWMEKNGVWDIVVEMVLHKEILESEGVPVEFKHRGKRHESWSLVIRGLEYHFRVQATPYGPREHAIYLKDSWKNGKALAVWRTKKDVRQWFDGITA